MVFDPGLIGMATFLAIFVGIVAIGYFLSVRKRDDDRKTRDRLRTLSGSGSPGWRWPGLISGLVARLPRLATLAMVQKEHVSQLRRSLLHAGFFQASAPQVFMAVRLLVTLTIALVGGGICVWMGPAGGKMALLCTLLGCGLGFLAPGFWLSTQVAKRQRLLRGALPDALDMLVLCMEGGVSFSVAMQRVTDEMQVVHPALGMEMNVIQREMQLGLSAGEALRKFGDRCGLSDVRDLAVVIIQSERYGASLTKALRQHADTSRVDRQQKTEETAQKAAVKILFPMLLFIFPAILIVVVGPAAFQIAKMFAH